MHRLNKTWRRRQCLKCSAIFTTEEVANFNQAWLVKNNKNKLGSFDRNKLFISLYKSLEHRKNPIKDSAGLLNTVMYQLQKQLSKSTVIDHKQIAQTVLVALSRFDKAAAIHYQAFHKY